MSDEQLCAGDASAPIHQALLGGRLCDFFTLVRSVLTHYNSNSPYVALDNWEGVACYECGYMIPGDEDYWCSGCEHRFCRECVTSCSQCEDYFCRGCLTECAACQELVCASCLSECPDCGRELCSNCLEDNECPCVEENEETGESEEDDDDQDDDEDENCALTGEGSQTQAQPQAQPIPVGSGAIGLTPTVATGAPLCADRVGQVALLP